MCFPFLILFCPRRSTVVTRHLNSITDRNTRTSLFLTQTSIITMHPEWWHLSLSMPFPKHFLNDPITKRMLKKRVSGKLLVIYSARKQVLWKRNSHFQLRKVGPNLNDCQKTAQDSWFTMDLYPLPF